MALGKPDKGCYNFQNDVVQKGIAQWNTEAEAARLKQLQQEKQIQGSLDNHWPWSNSLPKPRGLRNLRLEGLFPNKDFINAKRLVSPLRLGRPGGGAPAISKSGKRLVRIKEDPLLRFQWNKDLRRAVDIALRYKSDRKDQEEYRKQLEAQIAEKRNRNEMEKRNDILFHQKSFLRTPPWGRPGPGGTVWRPPRNLGVNFLKSLGWSNEATLKNLNKEMSSDDYLNSIRSDYQKFKKICAHPPTVNIKDVLNSPGKDVPKYNRLRFRSPTGKHTLSPLIKRNVSGEELVPLLAKQRENPIKVPLCTTDVTRGNLEIKKPGNLYYLQDLSDQIKLQRTLLKEIHLEDVEQARRHFQTLDNFWGRPGNGAPRSIIKKGHLDRLLYYPTINVQ